MMILIVLMVMVKYWGPWLRSAKKERSSDWTEKPSMNILFLPGLRVVRGGLEFFWVTKEELMVVLCSVSVTILAKPTTTTQIMARERSPPVRVLYWVSEWYLKSSEEQNMST